jgi:hypothetical protein
MDNLRLKIEYSRVQVLIAGIERTFKIALPYNKSKEICSRFVLNIYKDGGLKVPPLSGIIDPAELASFLEK